MPDELLHVSEPSGNHNTPWIVHRTDPPIYFYLIPPGADAPLKVSEES